MAQTQSIDVKIKAILDAGASVQGLKELKKLQKEVGAGSSEFKLAQAGINDFTDSIKTAKGQSQDWIDTLGSLPGPLGSIGRGLDTFTSSTNKLGLAFKSLGIGLIVSAVGALTAAFSQNDKMMKKLEPLMIGFEKILGGIFAALEPLIDAILELALQALPYITKGVGMFYSGLVSLFSLLKNVGGAVGKILKGIFTLDFDAVSEGIDQLGNSWNVAVKSFKETMGRYEAGTNELTKTEKKKAEERTKALETEAEKRKKIVDEINAYVAKGVEARGKTQQEELDAAKTTYDDLMAKAKKYGLDTTAITKSYEEQKAKIVKTYADKAKEDAQKDFDAKLKKQQDDNNILLNQQRANLEQAKVVFGENSAEARKAQDDIFAAQQKGLEDEKKLLESKKELTDAERTRLAQITIDQQNLTTAVKAENEKRLKSDRDTALKTLDDNKKARDEKFALDMAAAGMDFELQNQILQDKLKADEAYFAAQEVLYAGNKEKLDEIDRARLANQASFAQAEEQIRQKQVSLNLQAADAAINALGAETAAGKAALIAKQFILAKELVLEAKRTIAFSKNALAKSKIAVAEGTAQTAKVGFPQNIPLLILYAAQAVSIIKTVIDATKAAKETEGGESVDVGSIPAGTAVPKPRGMATGGLVQGAGGPKSDLIPAMLSNGESVINAQSTSMFRPLLSAINEVGGGKRFAEGGLAITSFGQDQTIAQLQTMMNTQQVPIKTYVVASDMTSQQMLDRNIQSRSTI